MDLDLAKNNDQLLNQALDAFFETTGLRAWVAPLLPFVITASQSDAILRIGSDNYEWDFSAKIKKNISKDTLAQTIDEIRELRPQGLLITTYVSAEQADKLRGANIPFLDTAGNTFIHTPTTLIYITGRRPTAKLVKEKVPRIFKASGLRVLFSLLSTPNLENSTYRRIAVATGTSLGTVGIVMEELESLGYLLDLGQSGRRLIKKQDLIRQWVDYYPKQLRPKLLASRYSSGVKDWWKKVSLEEVNAYWGGEVAAAMLTNT